MKKFTEQDIEKLRKDLETAIQFDYKSDIMVEEGCPECKTILYEKKFGYYAELDFYYDTDIQEIILTLVVVKFGIPKDENVSKYMVGFQKIIKDRLPSSDEIISFVKKSFSEGIKKLKERFSDD